MNSTKKPEQACGYKDGPLPACAPLAVPFVPMQQATEPAYESADALARGTLFPGLDLPLMNMVNKTPATMTPLDELMALDFVAHELALYLDTHREDREAFAMYQSFLKLAAAGREKYVSMYGPISHGDMIDADSFTWIDNPWPWDISSEG